MGTWAHRQRRIDSVRDGLKREGAHYYWHWSSVAPALSSTSPSHKGFDSFYLSEIDNIDFLICVANDGCQACFDLGHKHLQRSIWLFYFFMTRQ
jgi:hypothetical protein